MSQKNLSRAIVGKTSHRWFAGKMATKLFGRDLSEYDDLNVEEMLDKLTPAEIEELNNYVDPDVS